MQVQFPSGLNAERNRFKVAQHLASNYGDRAFVVARMCKITGKRWPIVGHRLHEEFPYVEAVCLLTV